MSTATSVTPADAAREPWEPAEAMKYLAAVQQALEARNIRPDTPALQPPGAEVVRRLRELDLRGVRVAAGRMFEIVARLPAGRYDWTIRLPPKRGDDGR
jgi:hypothetical protein